MIDVSTIQREIESAPWGSRTAIVEGYAESLGVTKHTVYRLLKQHYGPKKKVVKEQKIKPALIEKVAQIKMQGIQMGLGEREISTDLVIQILKDSGVPEADKLTVPTVNRRLAERGFRQRDAIVRVEAKFANQQHQLDFSRSKYFQLWKYDSKRGDYLLKAGEQQLTYKDEGTRFATWLVGITDAFSRVSLFKMYAATGESTAMGIDFLNHCYNRQEDEHPLIYLPDILKTDNGAFGKGKHVTAMLESLEIKKELVQPYKKRGIQKQEAAWKKLWRRFELPLALKLGKGKTIHLDDYNELLQDYCVNALADEHPIKGGQTRGHVYLTSIAAHPPRRIHSNLREAAFKVYERVVRQDLTVTINNDKFEAPQFCNGKKIRVYRNYAGEMVGELIDQFHKPFTLKGTKGFVELGNFKHRPAATYRQTLETKISAAMRKATEDNKIAYMPPREKEFVPETKFTEARKNEDYIFPDAMKARAYIGERLNVTYDNVAHIFDELLSDDEGLQRVLIDQVIDAVMNKTAASM